MYADSPTGLSPEEAFFTSPSGPTPKNRGYFLRPETVESMMYLYRKTGNEKYRDWGWQIVTAIDAHCRLDWGAYTSLVNMVTGERKNESPSFFFAETLKYLYLLFSPADVIPLDTYVFNTEAHPLKISNQGVL
jgi:mannosyl-oligosaccharide alpha-1,2-mannosidase